MTMKCFENIQYVVSLFSRMTRFGGAKNMSCKVFKLYLMNACLS